MPSFAELWNLAVSTLFTILSFLVLSNVDAHGSTCNGTNRSNRPGQRCGNPLNGKRRKALMHRLKVMAQQHPREWLDMAKLIDLAEDALCTRYHGKMGGEHSQIAEVAQRYHRLILEYCERIEAMPTLAGNKDVDRDARVMAWLIGIVDDEIEEHTLPFEQMSLTSPSETEGATQPTGDMSPAVYQGVVEAIANPALGPNQTRATGPPTPGPKSLWKFCTQ